MNVDCQNRYCTTIYPPATTLRTSSYIYMGPMLHSSSQPKLSCVPARVSLKWHRRDVDGVGFQTEKLNYLYPKQFYASMFPCLLYLYIPKWLFSAWKKLKIQYTPGTGTWKNKQPIWWTMGSRTRWHTSVLAVFGHFQKAPQTILTVAFGMKVEWSYYNEKCSMWRTFFFHCFDANGWGIYLEKANHTCHVLSEAEGNNICCDVCINSDQRMSCWQRCQQLRKNKFIAKRDLIAPMKQNRFKQVQSERLDVMNAEQDPILKANLSISTALN